MLSQNTKQNKKKKKNIITANIDETECWIKKKEATGWSWLRQ